MRHDPRNSGQVLRQLQLLVERLFKRKAALRGAEIRLTDGALVVAFPPTLLSAPPVRRRL